MCKYMYPCEKEKEIIIIIIIENDVLFQKVTQAYSEKKIRVLLSGVLIGALGFFSEYACVTFWNSTSFSFIHQAGNIPSHLFQ